MNEAQKRFNAWKEQVEKTTELYSNLLEKNDMRIQDFLDSQEYWDWSMGTNDHEVVYEENNEDFTRYFRDGSQIFWDNSQRNYYLV